MTDINNAIEILDADRARRENDPIYALEKAKDEFNEYVDKIAKMVQSYDGTNPADLTTKLNDKARRLSQKLILVQKEIDRVAEEEHPGWAVSRPRGIRYPRPNRVTWGRDDEEDDYGPDGTGVSSD